MPFVGTLPNLLPTPGGPLRFLVMLTTLVVGGLGAGGPMGGPGELAGAPASPAAGSSPLWGGSFPSDTFGDAHVRALLERGRAARSQGLEGLESYQGRMWERVYLGLDAGAFRRERGLIQEERSALVRWSAEGERRVLWEGARRDIPIAGLSSARDEGMAASLARELAESRLPPPLTFDPGSDRIFFGGADWALNPLADTAGHHYRFHSGDTLRITLPEDGRQVVLAEVRVEPRRSEFRLLVASLWFDTASGALVRGIYRPARPFDLALDVDTEDGGDVPRLLRPIRAEIRVVSVDHGFFDFQWWIPRRFLFEGEASVGRFARFPLRVEWTLGEVEVNAPVPPELSGETRPEGWVVTTEQVARASRGDSVPVVRIVPPPSDLASGHGVSSAPLPGRPSFSEGDLRELEARMASLLPAPAGTEVQWLWGLEESLLRFNRIEGLAAGVGARAVLSGGREVQVRVRSGVASPRPTADLTLRGGSPGRRWETRVFRDLAGASEWHDPTSVSASLGNVVNGEGPTPWYRSFGASARMERRKGGHRWSSTLFAERQSTADLGTSWHIRRLFDEDRILAQNILAREGTWLGVRAEHRWQSGLDPSGPRLFTSSLVEAAAGDAPYGRGSVTVGITFPILPSLLRGWQGALEFGGGTSVGELPPQRRFFPGGAAGYRAGRIGDRAGDRYWMARSELGKGFTGARGVVFLDALRVRHTDDVLLTQAEAARGAGRSAWSRDANLAVGVGVSLLDGLFRLDLARQLRPEGGWSALVYLDALF
jgi:hypothetical protein